MPELISQSYSPTLRLIHWVMALMVIGLFVVGWYMVGLDYYDPLYQQLPWWHKSVGVALLLLWLVRVCIRYFTTLPLPLKTHHQLEIKIAGIVKLLFYILILMMAVSGYLISTGQGETLSVFGWFEIPAFIQLESQSIDQLGLFHEILAWMIIALAALHALAALKHHFIDKDDTLIRMLKSSHSITNKTNIGNHYENK